MKYQTLLQSFAWAAILSLVVLIMPNGRAMAYLDPGTGSFIIQILVASLLGILMVLRVFWTRILNFVQGLIGGSSKGSAQDLDEI
jgi:hypothetical protein